MAIALALAVMAVGSRSGQLQENQVNQAVSVASPPSLAQPPATVRQWETLTLTCTGKIAVNNLDYTVVFSSEGGFSRITFSRATQEIATAQLNFSGRNDQQQTIWRGAVNGMADVVLIHLSDQIVQSGDEVSVGYDSQWGRGQCTERAR